MDVSIMLEEVQGNGYRATAMVPTTVVAEASTREEVVELIRDMISERLSRAELIRIEVPTQSDLNSWLDIAGTWRDHPDVDEVVENIQAYRREVDADPNRL